jgi:hypothetical protein
MLATVAIVIVVVGAIGVALVVTNNMKSQDTSSLVSSTTSFCSQIDMGRIGLTVLDSSTEKPLPGLPVVVTESSGECPDEVFNLGTFTTDSNGTVMTGGQGNFAFTVKYNGAEYNATGYQGGMGLTCVTLYVPTNQVTNLTTILSNSSNNNCPINLSVTSVQSRTNNT